MGYSVFPAPAAGSKTMYRRTLTSGTSWTVPTGVTYINVLCVGGGGGSSSSWEANSSQIGTGNGNAGFAVWSNLTTTPGASISYSIGAGGAAASGASGADGGTGGTTSFTGATSAAGGAGGGAGTIGFPASATFANNGGQTSQSQGNNIGGNAGGSGWIQIEYWV